MSRTKGTSSKKKGGGTFLEDGAGSGKGKGGRLKKREIGQIDSHRKGGKYPRVYSRQQSERMQVGTQTERLAGRKEGTEGAS